MSIDEANDPKLTNEPTQDSEPQDSQPHDGAPTLLHALRGGAS